MMSPCNDTLAMTLMRTTQVNPAEEPFAMLSGKKKKNKTGTPGRFCRWFLVVAPAGLVSLDQGSLATGQLDFAVQTNADSDPVSVAITVDSALGFCGGKWGTTIGVLVGWFAYTLEGPGLFAWFNHLPGPSIFQKDQSITRNHQFCGKLAFVRLGGGESRHRGLPLSCHVPRPLKINRRYLNTSLPCPFRSKWA